MSTSFNINDRVTFNCSIKGQLKGQITGFVRDIGNGQNHAVIELLQPHPPGCIYRQPVVDLKAA